MPDGRQIVTALIVGCLITRLDLPCWSCLHSSATMHEGASVLHEDPNIVAKSGVFRKWEQQKPRKNNVILLVHSFNHVNH